MKRLNTTIKEGLYNLADRLEESYDSWQKYFDMAHNTRGGFMAIRSRRPPISYENSERLKGLGNMTRKLADILTSDINILAPGSN